MRLTQLLARKKPSRTSPIVCLENIRVASPCMSDWTKMAGDERVRHCGECNLNVYNLSEMTRQEAERLIASREGRLCVRFYRRADGTILTQDCPSGLRAMKERVSRIAGAVLSAMMCVAPAVSQTPGDSSPHVQPGSSDKDAGLDLDVTVLDPTNAVIQNAKVVLCRCKGKNKTDAVTNAVGVAHFASLPKGTYEISVTAPGFRKLQQTITIKNVEQLQLKLKLRIAEQTVSVEVKAGPVEVVGTMGIVMTIQTSGFPPFPSSGGRPGPLR